MLKTQLNSLKHRKNVLDPFSKLNKQEIVMYDNEFALKTSLMRHYTKRKIFIYFTKIYMKKQTMNNVLEDTSYIINLTSLFYLINVLKAC